MRWRRALLLCALLSPGAAAAQAPITSPAPDAVAVTLYRASGRDAETPIDRDRPQGFALVTETRTLVLPAGRSVVRFEGVAGNIFPETALVAGLPAGVREKNLDADLLSPRSLYDRALGRRVMIRRTDAKTGRVVVEQATIRSSGEGAVVIERGGGFEALGCTGLNEAILYPEVPPGLSAKPTLSIELDSPAATTATVTLTYLAGGFDWQADYLLQLSPDGTSASLNAWATLASSDVTAFAGSAALVAGRVNREDSDAESPSGDELELACWPVGAPPPPPPPPPPVMLAAPPMAARMKSEEASDVIVVASTPVAIREQLADLNLYRVPGAVTVAPQAQKQVGLLAPAQVALNAVYRMRTNGYVAGTSDLVLRWTNNRASGLGVPLPAGRVVLFGNGASRPVLLGEGHVADKAVGEKVEIEAGTQPGVRTDIVPLGDPGISRSRRFRLTVTNATAAPIRYEAEFILDPQQRFGGAGARLPVRDGRPLWQTRVPAGGSVSLDYVLAERR
ncbi:hypothetical protein [Sphingomonas sp.]|uniref:DUF4139 domain-containing protein n=1 Tax=Sphingomonas sp. TaxID=28214 RepID=UPI001E0F45F2|nr:hypothetical protein [Sphingomonas sp.]MBX9797645.1 hypothetical protein [Sphingomonas sp.]